MSDFSDDDEGDYSTLVQRYRKKQQSTSSSSNRHALIEKKMNNNAGVKNGKPKVEKQKEDVASVSDSDDDDDDDLSLSEAPRKKPKPSLVVSHGDSDDELDCILNARLIEPSHPNHHKDTAAFDALAKITKELNAAEQAASLEKLPSFTPPRTPPEVFVDGRLRIRVKFATLDGQIETFDVGRAQTFETLFRQMSEKLSCSLPEVLVFWEGRSVMSSDTPLKLGLKADDFVIFDIYCKAQIGVKEAHVTSKPVGSISIKFQFQERDKTTTQFVTQEQTFGFIKETYAQNHGLDAAKIFFIFDGDRIGDDSTPSSLEMEDDDCVDVVVHK